MPVSPDQLTADVDFLTSQPGWKDETKRGDYIRDLAVNSRSNVDPEEHRAVIGKLWELQDDRGLIRKSTEFVGRAVEEVAKSAVAMPVAAGMAVTDAVGMTDTGSGTRLAEGVKNLADQTGQVVKQAMPGKSKQAERDELLGFLKQDLDEGAVPDELENWLAGDYDGKDLPEPLQPWVDGLSRGIAKKAVAADFSGDVPPEKVNAWLTTDRNPLFSDSDDGTPGPRELLADYVATRDPKSWEAFQNRVTETDQQYQMRVRRGLSERQFQADVQGVGGFTGEMIGRAADMQTSPIDLASAVLPVLRGSKALMAARAGKAGLAKDLAIGAAKEGVQEGVTEKLTDARASAMEVGEAAAMGAIGGGALEGGMAGVGALSRQLSRPVTSPTVEGDLPGTPVPESERSPGMTGLEEDTGDLTLDDVADLEGTAADARFMPPPNLTSGLTDLGTIEGDLLTDARFRPPAGAVAPALQPLPNVADQSGLTDIGTVEGDVLERVPQTAPAPVQDPATLPNAPALEQPAPAPTNLADIQRGDRFTDQEGNTWEVWKSRQGTVEAHPVINGKPVVNNQTTERWATTPEARTRNPSDRTDMTPAGGTVITDPVVNESLTPQDEAQTAQADAVIAQESQARGIRPPTPGTVSRQGSALPFEEIVGMAAAAIRNGVTSFSVWATAMVRRFGEGVRQMLASAWQAATAAANRAAKAPVTFGQRPLDRRARAGEGGFTGGSPLGQDGPPNLAETRSRFARPDAPERLYEVRADADVRQQAETWLGSMSMEQAVAAMEAGRLPASMTMDVAQQAAGLILQRTTEALRTGTEVQQMQARTLGHRMSRVWQGWLSQEAGRSLRQRAVVNAELVPYAPILAAEGLLIDRADAVVGKRFEGGAKGAAAKVAEVSRKAGGQAGADLAADLDQAQGRITAKDSPMLVRLLNTLRKKMAPGMTWADIFMELPSTQRERQRAIYQRLMLDERLRDLSADERLKLTNELDKAWQRERRKVFNRELQRAGVLGEKGLADRVKIQKAMPKLMRLINLGMMNSEMFREAIAPQYGLRMISSADAVGLRKLAEEAWALPEGVLRNRKLGEMLDSIQRTTGGSVAEILNSYWVAAVLSGLRTMFDTFMAVTTGFGTSLTQQGMLLARGKGRAAWQAHGQWWRGLGQGLDESFGILWNGDYRFQKRFNEDLRRAMDGESTFRPVPLGEALWRQGGLWKFPAAVMLWTGRLMAAADHINNTATTHGAMAVARALNPELYAGKAGFTPQERAAAEAQALNEVTGGTSPANADERRTVKVRAREILHGLLKPETRTEANFIGDESAYQNDPIGILGGIYQMLNAGLGFGERLTLAAAQRINGQGPGAGFARGAMAFAAGALRSATGTKFARFGANFGNHIWSFVPGSYLVSRGGQALGNIERTRSQNDLLLGRNVIGLALGVSTFALLGNKDDEDDGMHMEGSWSGLTFEEKAQRRSAGFEPLTLWWRDGDKIKRLSYKSWPTAGVFAGVGAYADERRFQPARAAARGWAGHLLHAASAGALQIKDVNAMRGLAEIFGASASSSDPEADFVKRMVRLPVGFAGGFVPTGVKDLDALRDPRSYRAEGVMEELARSVPGLRQTVNGGRPSITQLGDPIVFDRKPWSRAFTSAESTEPYRVLGVLLSRGLSLPAANTERYVWHEGAKVQIKSLGREAEYKYAKAVYKGYKEWLSTEGQDLLTQPPEAIARQIRSQSERIKMMAALQAFGGN
jgi:hypothetical protein